MADFDEAVRDEIVLAVPGTSGAGALARLVAAELCGRLGFSVDEVAEVTLAVEQLCADLVEHKGGSERLDLRFRPLNSGVEVVGRVDDPEPASRSTVPLNGMRDGLVDEYERIVADGVLLIRVLKVGKEADPDRLLLGIGVGRVPGAS